MIMRSLDLCNKSLREDWQSFPHQFLILLQEELKLITCGGGDGDRRKGPRGSRLKALNPSAPPAETLRCVL